MGSVWAARNELTDRDFAIKFLLSKLADNKEALQRFFHEARACGQIKHPAVVDVYDMGQAEDGSPYLVMELLEGEGFDQRLSRAGVFRPGEAAAWIAFIARGLEEAHVRGLVHRDLKPGNVFFALDDRGDVIPKILDFGVSKETGQREGDFAKTSTGAVLGSPAYMSPEQARGEVDVDSRSDVWSLGVILYEALTGRVPFDAPNYNALMLAIITKPHPSVLEVAPDVPVELSQIIDHALAKERVHRIGTARELADRLEMAATRLTHTPFPQLLVRTPTLSGGQSPIARSETQNTWSDQTTLHRTKRPAWMIAAIAAVGLGVVVAGAVAVQRLRPPMVAVAARSSLALTTRLARVQRDVERIHAEAVAERKAKEQAEAQATSVVLAPSELPTVKDKPAPAGPAGAQAKPAGKPRKNDPHGGVDSAGF